MEKTFKYVELFAGIGGFRTALDGLGGECMMASEIDVFATKAYKALYNGAPELRGDVTKIDTDNIPDHDLLVGGFPCQAFSVAGQRRGFEEARGTLFFEIARIASAKRPAFMMLENVKGLLSHDGGNTFTTMAMVLNDIGYAMDFTVLNSKHFGVPQNRERIIIVCSRDAEHADWARVGTGVVAKAKRRIAELGVRTFNFDWPTNDTVTTRLRDILENNVAERYYLSDAKTATLLAQLQEKPSATHLPIEGEKRLAGWRVRDDRVFAFQSDAKRSTAQEHIYLREGAIADSVTVGHMPKFIGVEPSIVKVGHLECDSGQTGAVYGADGIAPTLLNQHGNAVTKIVEPSDDGIEIVGRLDEINGHDLCKRVYGSDGIAPTIPKIAVENVGNVNPSGNGMNGSVYADSGLAPTLTTNKGEGTKVLTEVRAVLTPDRPEKRQNGRRFKDNDEPSFTLTAQDKHGVAIGAFQRYRIRKLTPLECFRLQAFTDEQHDIIVKAGISDSQRYKMAGNAVTVNVIKAVGIPLVALLTAKPEVVAC